MRAFIFSLSIGVAALAPAVPAATAFGQSLADLFPQLATVIAPDGAANEQFGLNIAIDGDTMVVGTPNTQVGTNFGQGCARVFVRTNGVWSLQQTLVASNGTSSSNFGASVAISGDTIVAGVPGDRVGNNFNQGTARVFTRVNGVWTQQATLSAATGAFSDQFGKAVAISGDTVAVGMPGASVSGMFNRGAARVFVRSGTSWSEQATLVAADGAFNDQFGSSIAISGDTVAVGVPSDAVGSNFAQGSVSVFVRTGSSWSAQQSLTAPDGAASDFFGRSVAISGDTLVIGANQDDIGTNNDQGSVRVFARSGSAWTQQQVLTAFDGAALDNFGWSVGISGDTIVAGVRQDAVGANQYQGSARVFARSGVSWTEQATLAASNGIASEFFGSGVAISGTTIAVGAPNTTVGSNQGQGSVRVYGNYRVINQSWGSLEPSLYVAVANAGNGDRLVVGDAAMRQSFGVIDASQKRLTFAAVQPMTLSADTMLLLGADSVFMRPPAVAAAGLTVAGKLVAPLGASVSFEDLTIGSGGQFLQQNASVLVNQGFATASGGVSYLEGPILAESVSTAAGGQHRVAGSTDIFSNYNNAGSTVVQRGILYIYGSLVNTGTMTGQVNNGYLPPAPGDGFEIRGDYVVGANSSLVLADPAWWLRVGGNLDIAINSPSRFSMGVATIEMTGGGPAPQQTFEAMSRNLGAVDSAFGASNYLVGALRVRAGASVALVDNHRNAVGKGDEAVYTKELVVGKGATLVTNGITIYTRSATIAGTVSNPDDIVVVPAAPACVGDIVGDGVVNGADLTTVLIHWGPCAGSCVADIDGDGQVGAQDLAIVLSSWGACPQS